MLGFMVRLAGVVGALFILNRKRPLTALRY
jgi:hypothetical protein